MSQRIAALGRRETLVAAICALVVLLLAWFLPLPPIVAGEEAIVTRVLPERRSEVATTGQQFRDAQTRYLNYVHTHDLAAVLTITKEALASAQAAPHSDATAVQVRSAISQVLEYGDVLHGYAAASDNYFPALQRYDSDLMSWTRSLGAATESMRKATFPFVDHLRLYPLPAGEALDPRWVHAPEVQSQLDSLRKHLAALDSGANEADKVSAIKGISEDVGNVWESGRSVEYVSALHNTYGTMLAKYDGQVQSKAAESSADQGVTGTRRVIANSLNLTLGLTLFAGFAAIFIPSLKRTA